MDDLKAGRWQQIFKSFVTPFTSRLERVRKSSGQSMVEYTLIAVLVALAIGTTIVLTKGSIGNIFSNTVYNVLGQTTTPYVPPNSQTLNVYASAFFQYQASPSPYRTNTPLAPTCSGGGSWAVTKVAPDQGTFVFC